MKSRIGQTLFQITLIALAVANIAVRFEPENPSRNTAAVIPPDVKNKSSLSSYKNWGLVNSRARSHIQALDAWEIEKGNHNVVVAVIDTGIDPNHRDLKTNIWKKTPLRAPNHKLLNQKNIYGWDFVSNKDNPTDVHGHGTHVAGIIGAVSNPTKGISGVAQSVSIMAVKYYAEGNSGSVNLKNTIQALQYAIDNGAQIINYSGGGPEFSQEEYTALKKAEAKGILVVAAAGNEGRNVDIKENYYYPSAYGLSNILSVAAIDINNNLLSSSNWGTKKVDIAAPGENIYSTLPKNKYGYMSGTSQATAFASGVAALLLSKDSSLSAKDIKSYILSSVDVLPSLKSKVKTGGKLNAFRALQNLLKKKNKLGEPDLLATHPGSIFPSSFFKSR